MRYVGNSAKERQAMLREIGVAGMADLIPNIPTELMLREPLPLAAPLSETELIRVMKEWAGKNAATDDYSCFLGAGAYHHSIPAVIDSLVSRSEFLTAYTPYQPEISQGTLQAIFEFQSFLCLLTGMDVANASLYDGSTAAAEAAFMTARITGRNRILVSRGLHPEYRQVLETYTRYSNLQVETAELDAQTGTTSLEELQKLLDKEEEPAAMILQSPNFFGCLEDVTQIASRVHEKKAMLGVAVTEPLSLALVQPPAGCGADIVFGEGQSFGVPLSYGGPYVGFFTTRDEFRRHMPGRIVGRARDTEGRNGFVLTLSTREQHIRREKATSNICTNEGLCALMAGIYLSSLGKRGLRAVAEQNIQKAGWLKEQIRHLPGYDIPYTGWGFNEFVVRTPCAAREVVDRLLSCRILGGLPLDRYYDGRSRELLLCVTELNTRKEMETLLEQLKSLS